MSYCRFSSDDFQCDVYVYEDCYGGWTTHVASCHRVFREPLPPVIEWSEDNHEAFCERDTRVMEMVDKAELVPIGLPHDGAFFNDETPGECAERLKELKAMGYLVPQYAIDALLEEAGPPKP